jgi:hypothetical protein
MKRSGQINIFTVLMILVVFLTFCDKKKDPAPVQEETLNTSENTNSASGTSITPVETITVGALNNNSTTTSSTTGTTGGTTGSGTSKDATISPDPASPGSQNTTLQVGTLLPGWTMDPCTINGLVLTGTNGLTIVTLQFGGLVIASGNYTLTSNPVPGIGQVKMTVLNPPGQPIGSTWISKSGGTVSVNVGTSTTVAAFTAVQCTQPLFPYPIVTVSGDVSCQ